VLQAQDIVVWRKEFESFKECPNQGNTRGMCNSSTRIVSDTSSLSDWSKVYVALIRKGGTILPRCRKSYKARDINDPLEHVKENPEIRSSDLQVLGLE
jgi:hypothetical protein